MKDQTALNLYIAGCAISLFAGCASTNVDVMNQDVAQLPKPQRQKGDQTYES